MPTDEIGTALNKTTDVVCYTDIPAEIYEVPDTKATAHIPSAVVLFKVATVSVQENPCWALIAKQGRLRVAMPILKLLLLRDIFNGSSAPYGWEGWDYSDRESFLDDLQYPYQNFVLSVIQDLSAQPKDLLIEFEAQQIQMLQHLGESCSIEQSSGCTALWLLRKMHRARPHNENR